MRSVLLTSVLPTVICLTASCLLGGCGGATSTLIVRPNPGWAKSQSVGQAQYRAPDWDLDGRRVPVMTPPVRTTDPGQVSLSGLIAARREIAKVAAERGLTQRDPTADEQKAEFTEVYDGAGGAGAIKVREERLGRWLEVVVTEPGVGGGGGLKKELSQRLGLEAMPEVKEEAGAGK